MNKENMLKWAEALESGEYKQIRDGWGDGCENFCCLHVAYKMITGKPIDWNDEVWEEDGNYIQNTLRGHLYPGLQTFPYYILNDVDQLTFPEIAQVIREKVNAAD